MLATGQSPFAHLMSKISAEEISVFSALPQPDELQMLLLHNPGLCKGSGQFL